MMDEPRLDRLSRVVAHAPHRRAVLAGLGVILSGAVITRTSAPVAGEGEGWVAVEGLGICRLPGFPCGNNGQCCAGGCSADGTCGCRKRGRTAWLAAICCSGKKKRGNKGRCR